jgi:hypothetical protein
LHWHQPKHCFTRPPMDHQATPPPTLLPLLRYHICQRCCCLVHQAGQRKLVLAAFLLQHNPQTCSAVSPLPSLASSGAPAASSASTTPTQPPAAAMCRGRRPPGRQQHQVQSGAACQQLL